MESAGNIEPDVIIQQGIKVLQQKLATLIRELSDESGGGGAGDEFGGPGRDGLRSPRDVNMGDGAAGAWGPADGFTTPYGGGQSAWGGAVGAQSPYGATPYGNSGGWN